LNITDEIIVDSSLELKQKETVDFKKLLYILAAAVIIVTAVRWLSFELLDKLFTALADGSPEVAEPAEPVFMSELEYNILFFISWFINHFVIFAPALLIFGLVFRKRMEFQKTGEPYEFKKSWIIPIFILSYTLSVISGMISSFIAYIMRPVFGGEGLRDVFEGAMPQTSGQVIIMLILVGFIGPVCEELIYRHWLLVPLRRFGDMQAVVITALLFGFFHGNLTQLLYTTIAGLIYGIVAIRANSVVPAMILHIINNCYIVLYAHLSDVAEATENHTLEGILIMSFYAVLVAGLFFLIYFLVKKRLSVENSNPHLPSAERARIVAENPMILLMMIVIITYTIIGS